MAKRNIGKPDPRLEKDPRDCAPSGPAECFPPQSPVNPESLPPPSLTTPGQRITWARKRRGLSAAALARQLGLTRGAVALWSHPTAPSFPYRRLQQLSDILGVRVEWLVTGQGDALRESSDCPQDRAPLALSGTPIIGIAEAEVWREGALMPEALLKASQPPIFIHLNPTELAGLRPFAFQVQGQSASRTLAPGSYALCVDYRQIRSNGPRSGDLVVVRKCRGIEHKILVARLHGHAQDWELRFESLEPRWQRQASLRLSHDLTRDLTDDSSIELLGLVYAALRFDPQPFGSS